MTRTLLLALGLAAAAQAEVPLADRRSGTEFMSPATRAMQADEATHPAVLWLLDGEDLWIRKPPGGASSCADCHGDARRRMRGVAVRYPAWNPDLGRPIGLEQRINLCRSEQQKAAPYPWESRELLALTALVARASRGLPIAVEIDAHTQPHLDAGRELFFLRQGQLNLSCAQCHDERWGRQLGGSTIPQAHPTGYPIYRLEWQSMGSLQRRLRGCASGVRAEPYPFGAPEWIDLELYLMWRARGMSLEAPAVRP